MSSVAGQRAKSGPGSLGGSGPPGRASDRTSVVIVDAGISARPVEELVLTWSISRAGAAACGMVQSGTGQPVKLELRISSPRRNAPPRAAIAARVVDGDISSVLPTSEAAGAWIEDSIAGVWHLDVEGLLKLTIRHSPEKTEALYARTQLLAKAGLGGGRYEFEGAVVRAAARS